VEIAKIEGLQSPLAASPNLAVAKPGPTAGGGGFLDMLTRSLDHVNQSQALADSSAQQYQLGQNGVSLEDSMISMQKANITFQTAVQVRNKLVAAYHDIMNMQV
jgi:flagellar hook-basal body complex protein FliE